MTRIGKLYARTLQGRALTFAEFEWLLRAFGFELDHLTGSHHIYRHPSLPRRLPIQPQGKDAKRYQVRQFLDMIEDHRLSPIDEERR